jgi:A/G-specific adenine glycosylase
MDLSREGKTIDAFERAYRERGPDRDTVVLFRRMIYSHYRLNRRDLPWRRTKDPYHVLVSEVMLQQTQVDRVVDKYKEFLEAFPDIQRLAKATLKEVLSVWQGLGYNRRAKALREAAQMIRDDFGGTVPPSIDDLVRLPGIGKATAASIAAFAFNIPTVFIETNVRTVFIHFFFKDKKNISDADVLPLVEKTLDRRNPRRWYNALMDYGTDLKKTIENPGRRSIHYQRQSTFRGSDRQVRGAVLRLLGTGDMSERSLRETLGTDVDRLALILGQLTKEGFIRKRGRVYTIA